MKKRVIIIGGGASGLAAAVAAARGGAETTVLEYADKPGKKLLATGNGRCNYTNTEMKDLEKGLLHYHSLSDPDRRFIRAVFERFGYEETIAFFRELGIVPKIRHYAYDDSGYVYPNSSEASSVLQALLAEAEAYNVSFLFNARVFSIAHLKDAKGRPLFQVDTAGGMLTAEAVIVACGSPAGMKPERAPRGFEIPAAFGHLFWEYLPSLCAIRCVGSFFKELKGVRADCRLRLTVAPADKKTEALRRAELADCGADYFGFLTDEQLGECYESFGEVQFTDYGVSGIPAFQLSRYAALAVKLRRERYLTIDFRPEEERKETMDELFFRAGKFADRTADRLLNGLLPQKLALLLIEKAGIRRNSPVYLLGEKELSALTELIHGFRLSVLDTNGFDSCQCCAGGVDTGEIDAHTMESKLIDGLYLAGEVIDVSADCGGYNLQWAWSSGVLAGRAAAGNRH